MKVIPPVAITAAMLTSSTIAEPDSTASESTWVSGNTYPSIGTKVILVSTHHVYYKLTTNVSTNLTVAPNLNPTDWLDLGYDNKWAMFDVTKTQGSVYSSDVTVVLTPSSSTIDSICLIGCIANSVTITVTSGGPTTYSYTTLLTSRNTTGWYSYFYGSFVYKANLALFNIPPASNNIITITFSMPTNGVIGNILLGTAISLGDIQTGPTLEALNFSTITRDAYGNSLLVPRRSIPRTTQKVFTTKSNVNTLMTARNTLNAVPALWVGIEDNTDLLFDPLLVFGVYKEFSISMDYPNYAMVSLQLEEM